MKLTVNKPVFWSVSGKKMAGKVKQIMGDHVVVKGDDAEYIVNKSCLSTAPISRLASLTVIAALKDKNPNMIKLEFDLETGTAKMTWLDEYDDQGRMKGCSSDAYDEHIKEADAIFKEGLEGVTQAWNQPPPPAAQTVKPVDKVVKKDSPKILGPGVVPTGPQVKKPLPKKNII